MTNNTLNLQVGGFGLRVYENPLLERDVPARQHKQRRGQSAAYHRRIQKKWVKRWGTKTERFAVMMNAAALGFGSSGLYVHPKDAAILRNLGT